jgi:malate dehydrogenase
MGVASDGSYGIPEGVVFSYPVRCVRGEYQIVQGLEIDEFARGKLAATDAELREERAGVATLL